jgi:hypothetical protein
VTHHPTVPGMCRTGSASAARGLPTVQVAAATPAVGLRPELPLKLHQTPDPGAIGADVRLNLGGKLTDGGQADAE